MIFIRENLMGNEKKFTHLFALADTQSENETNELKETKERKKTERYSRTHITHYTFNLHCS